MLWSYLIWKKELRFIETAESTHNGLMKNCSCPREIKEMDPIVMSMPISQTKKCFENYGYTLCPWWPEEIFRLSNWLMMFHCVWTSKDLLFFMHWFTFWFCHLQVFFYVWRICSLIPQCTSVWLFLFMYPTPKQSRHHPVLS